MKTTQLMFLAVITLASAALAVDPPPDGGYANQNTAEGQDALFSLTTGTDNTAVGANALYNNTTGFGNTATGSWAASNAFNAGSRNTANGAYALQHNDSNDNTATGYFAMQGDGDFVGISGSNNTAAGSQALHWLTAGSNNTATGASAMSGVDFVDILGSNNTATGFEALSSIESGTNNTANGVDVLFSNISGNNNTAVGQNSLLKNTTGKSNIAIGSNAGFNLTTGSSNIDIANRGVAGESKTIRVGIQGTQTATFMAGISGATVPAGVGVIIDTNGHLGTVVSSQRYKDHIQPMDNASEAILSLEPVRFRYKKELDPKGIPQFGLVAEQVAKVDPDLVAHDEEASLILSATKP